VCDSLCVGWVMTDHPSWLVGGRTTFRVVRYERSVWVPTSGSGDGVLARADLISGTGAGPALDVFDPMSLVGPEPLVARLRELGLVARWRNPDLWDAMATAC
jgi:DNA-3-methyladenine glycosylase II